MSSNESTAYDAAMHQYEKQYDGLKAELQTLGFIGQGSVSTRRITSILEPRASRADYPLFTEIDPAADGNQATLSLNPYTARAPVWWSR